MKVLVCDDRDDRCKEVESAISAAEQSSVDVIKLVGPSLKAELEKLFDHVEECFKDLKGFKLTSASIFDTADLVIVDNNLAHLNIRGSRLTAESVVGYIRAFTAAPYVISLNKNPDVDFDLRYLVGDYATRADLALNTQHLENPALWSGKLEDAKDGFIPWYWPALLSIPGRRRAQIDFVQAKLNASVVSSFDIPDAALDFLSLHARGALSSGAISDGGVDGAGTSFHDLTFRDVFVDSTRSLPDKRERQDLRQAAEEGNVILDKVISRIVASDVDLWFRRDVLGPQEALVDVPHLLGRFPFLLGKEAKKIDAWNKAAGATTAPLGLEENLFTKHLSEVAFNHGCWVESPSFWWPQLKADDALNALFFEAKDGEWLDVVFCEDLSKFVQSGTNPPPVEFSAEFEGSWGRRYVARIPGIRYAPRSRFAI